jgi:hypothetical protein
MARDLPSCRALANPLSRKVGLPSGYKVRRNIMDNSLRTRQIKVVFRGVVTRFNLNDFAEDTSHSRPFLGANRAPGICHRCGQRLASR